MGNSQIWRKIYFGETVLINCSANCLFVLFEIFEVFEKFRDAQ